MGFYLARIYVKTLAKLEVMFEKYPFLTSIHVGQGKGLSGGSVQFSRSVTSDSLQPHET